MNKEVVHKHLLAAIESKIIQTQEVLNDATISIHNETKSSAGDKHETGRAMAQLEQEKLGKQLQLIKNLRDAASRISFSEINSQIGFGSLVKWNNQWVLFLSWVRNYTGGKYYCILSVNHLSIR